MLLVSHLERHLCIANTKTACVQYAAFHYCGWHFQVNATYWSSWYWSSTSYSRKLGLYILITMLRMISGVCTSLPTIFSLPWSTTLATSKVDVPQNLCIYSIGPDQCVIILIILFYFFLPRLLFGQSGLILFSYFFNFSFTVVGWVFALVLLLVTLH